MCNILLRQALDSFREEDLGAIRIQVQNLRQPCSFPDYILSHRTTQARRKFIDTERIIQTRLSACRTIDDIIDVCRECFLPIRGIGEATILKYAYYAAFQREIDPEASCCSFLLTSTKSILERIGVLRNRTINETLDGLFDGLSNYEVSEFFNRRIGTLKDVFLPQ